MDNKSLNEILATNGVRVALVGVLAILALFLLAETITLGKDFGRSGTPATDTITVEGSGQATLPPDVARVSFTVQNTAKTVSEAQTATTKQANAAIDFVKAQGVEDKDIKTLSYNIYPQYSYPNPCRGGDCPVYSDNTPKIIGYQVSQSIQVSLRDLTKVGEFLGGIGKLEVQNVNGPAFTLDDTTAGYNAARADAIEKAKIQARLLSRQLGVHLGNIVNFSESSGRYPSPMYDNGFGVGMMSAKAEASPTIPAGENTYNASVSITYEIR